MKANGEIDSDKVLEAIRDGISDPSKLEQAVALHINCHREGNKIDKSFLTIRTYRRVGREQFHRQLH